MNGSAVPAAVTQEARLTPIPGVGIFALGGRGAFCRLRRREKCCRAAAGEMHAAACGDAPLPGRGAKGGTGHPDLRPGFLYPLLRLPLTFRSAAQRSFAAKKRGPQLRPLSCPGRFNAVWGWLRARFPRITVRGSGVTGYNWLLGTLRRAGCSAPPSLTVCTGVSPARRRLPLRGNFTGR